MEVSPLHERVATDSNDFLYIEAEWAADQSPSTQWNSLGGVGEMTRGEAYQAAVQKRDDRGTTFYCSYEGCEKTFNRLAKFEDHQRVHSGERPFECLKCGQTYKKRTHLNYHTKSQHSTERTWQCQREGCLKAFSSRQKLDVHGAAHVKHDRHRCTDFPPCNQQFRKLITLQRHIEQNHTQDFQEDAQSVCGHVRRLPATLLMRTLDDHGIDRYLCLGCTRETTEHSPLSGPPYSSFQEIKAHIQMMHQPECEACDERYAQLWKQLEAKSSRYTRGTSSRKTYECPEDGCDQVFSRKNGLTTHVARVHNVGRRYVCGETDVSHCKDLEQWEWSSGCGASYVRKVALENHIRRKHVATPNELHYSDKPKRADGLSVTPAVCTYQQCGVEFARSGPLVNHLKDVHGLTDTDVAEVIIEQQALQGGAFWVGVDNNNGMDLLDLDIDDGAGADDDRLDAQGYIDPALLS